MFSTAEGITIYMRDITSTFRDVQYTGGISWVHCGDTLCTLRDTTIHVGRYHDFLGGYSVRLRVTMIHVGEGYHEYIEKCSVFRGFPHKINDFSQ